MTALDVVIVGAGAAGLAAAREATVQGLTMIVVEALNRTGGRAWTESMSFGVPVDWGCHWLHSASLNPMRELADSYGVSYRENSSSWRIYDESGPLDDEQTDIVDRSAERCFERFLEAGQRGVDAGISDLIDADEPGYEVFRTWMQAEWSVAAERVSSLDASRYLDTEENWPVLDGYGALVQRHARGVPVSLGTTVQSIDWRSGPIRIVTNKGLIEADRVILTVSTNVLAEQKITFTPSLPSWKVEAAAAVPLGTANKVVFGLDPATSPIRDSFSALVPFAGSGLTSLQFRPYERDLISFYLAGPVAADLERQGSEAMVAACRETLSAVFGSKIGGALHSPASVRWGSIETIRGAYASAQPGFADRRSRLGEPIADRLFFAGEATHPEFFSTCHGAHLSGIRSVAEVEESRARN